MDDLLVECPIHLDAVSIKDILVFKCGHGFCEPCLGEHFAHHGRSSLSCPTCRKPVRRNEAFPVFLAPAHSLNQATHGGSAVDAAHTRLIRELKEAKAVHANCPGQFIELQKEIDTLRQDRAHHNQTIQHLRGRYELLDERLGKEVINSARAREEGDRWKEEVTRLQIENHKSSIALEQALKEVQVQLERVKMFQGYIEQYKHKCSLERKKRKAIEDANLRLLPRKEDESLMVVDTNAPDTLHQDGLDFGWLDEACKVKGDHFAIPSDEELESEKESGDQDVQVRLIDPNENTKPWKDQAPKLSLQFSSDWHLGLEGSSSKITRKRKQGSEQVGSSKIVKVKMPVTGSRKPGGVPLTIDRHGHVKGTVTLGPRQKLNSKN